MLKFRSRPQGTEHPDGLQAVASLAKQREFALEKYQTLLAQITGHALNPKSPHGPVVGKPLTNREIEVLTFIARGKSTKEAAHALGISYKTADSHRSKIHKKLDAHKTADLTRAAIRMGLVAP